MEFGEKDEILDNTGNVNPQLTIPHTKNFKASEFACKDGTAVPPELWGNLQLLMNNLQKIRDHFGKPIDINSGYRTPTYNSTIKDAAKNSTHTTAKAVDFNVRGVSPSEVRKVIETMISSGQILQGGLGKYSSFVHYDVRGKRARW